MASSRGQRKATAQCRLTMMVALQVTLMKVTIGDPALEAASTASSRVVCTAARVTQGTTTHPTRTRSTCPETTKRTKICGKCSIHDGLRCFYIQHRCQCSIVSAV